MYPLNLYRWGPATMASLILLSIRSFPQIRGAREPMPPLPLSASAFSWAPPLSYHARSLAASGRSGSTSTPELPSVPRFFPLKSPIRALFRARTGWTPLLTSASSWLPGFSTKRPHRVVSMIFPVLSRSMRDRFLVSLPFLSWMVAHSMTDSTIPITSTIAPTSLCSTSARVVKL